MRLVRNTVALLAVLLAVPAAASAAQVPSTITVSNAIDSGDPGAMMTFKLTGPACSGVPTDFTFELGNGESKSFTLCDANPKPVNGRFKAVEVVPAGWQLTNIECQTDDLDPNDETIIDMPNAAALIELSGFNEHKSCTFHNAGPAPAPPAPPVVAPQPPAPVSAPAPASAVAGVKKTSPARIAALGARSVCTSRTVRVTVRGHSLRDVRLSLNGRHVKTLKVKHGVTVVRSSLRIGRRTSAQVVTARVRFRNGARAKTLTAHAARCAIAAVKPSFTG